MSKFQHPDVKTNYYIEIAQDLMDRGYLRESSNHTSQENTIEEIARALKDIHEKGIVYGKAVSYQP